MSDECRKAFNKWCASHEPAVNLTPDFRIWQAAWSARGDGWVSVKELIESAWAMLQALNGLRVNHEDPILMAANRLNKALLDIPPPPKGDE